MLNQIVPTDQVLNEAMTMAKKIAAYPSMGVIQAKRAMNQSMETALSQGLRFDDEAWIACMHSDAWKEKLGEFARTERKSSRLVGLIGAPPRSPSLRMRTE